MLKIWLTVAALLASSSLGPVARAGDGEHPDRAGAQRAADAEEADWYEEDDARRARVKALPLPKGDACKVTFDDGVFNVAGIPVFFPFGDDTPNSAAAENTMIFNLRRGKTLFVGIGDLYNSELYPFGDDGWVLSHTLWTIDCSRRPLRPRRYFDAPRGVDFGHALVAAGGKALYVTSEHGIARFSIGTKSLREILQRPQCEISVARIESDDDIDNGSCLTVLLPVKLSGNVLEFTVAVPEQTCHDNGPSSQNYLVDVTSAAMRSNPYAWRRPSHIGAFASAGGEWLVGLRETDGSDFTHHIWRSADAGETWAPISIDVRDGDDASSQLRVEGIEAILVDARDAKRVLVMSSPRHGYHDTEPRELFVTSDGGTRWSPLALPEGEALTDVWSDGTLDHLFITHGEGGQRFGSRDGGKTWSPSKAPRPPRRTELPTGYVTDVFGLWRVSPERVLLFPPPNMQRPISISGMPVEPTPRAPIGWPEWDTSAAANKRGLELAKNQQYPEAIAAYRDAWTANPNNAWARYNAACAHALAGNGEAAMLLLEELHQRRGQRDLALLAAAAADKDLVSLGGRPRFRLLTAASRPLSAWAAAPSGHEIELFSVPRGVISDRDERMCLWGETASAEYDRVALERFDCRTGAAQGTLRGSPVQVYTILDDLGMRRWTRIREADESWTKASSWALRALKLATDAEPNLAIFRAPSGKRIAAGSTRTNDDGDNITKLVFGSWRK